MYFSKHYKAVIMNEKKCKSMYVCHESTTDKWLILQFDLFFLQKTFTLAAMWMLRQLKKDFFTIQATLIYILEMSRANGDFMFHSKKFYWFSSTFLSEVSKTRLESFLIMSFLSNAPNRKSLTSTLMTMTEFRVFAVIMLL